jgi:hypothetical protein
MTTAQPVTPVEVPAPPSVRASTLAAWQLVEDARYRPERSRRNERRRLLAQRAVADRKTAREELMKDPVLLLPRTLGTSLGTGPSSSR